MKKETTTFIQKQFALRKASTATESTPKINAEFARVIAADCTTVKVINVYYNTYGIII